MIRSKGPVVLERFLDSFATGLIVVIAVLGFALLFGGGLFVWALIRLARGRPSAGIGALLVIIGTSSLGYALYAAAGEHLLPSERVHHIVWPAVVGAIIVSLGIVHVVRAVRKKELAFLE